jgi:hypothetical protein
MTPRLNWRIGVTLAGGEPVPLRSLGVILRHTPAAAEQDAEVILCGGMSLIGSPAKPLRSFRAVLGHAFTRDVHVSEVVLGVGIALLGERTDEPQGGYVIPRSCARDGLLEGPAIAACAVADTTKNANTVAQSCFVQVRGIRDIRLHYCAAGAPDF